VGAAKTKSKKTKATREVNMAAKTARSDDKLMEMVEKSGIPALGLLTAEVIDLKENTCENNKAMMKEIKSIGGKLDRFITVQKETEKDVAENKASIKENREAITEIKIKDVKTVAIISGISGALVLLGNWLL
jgi:hypothetical protein